MLNNIWSTVSSSMMSHVMSPLSVLALLSVGELPSDPSSASKKSLDTSTRCVRPQIFRFIALLRPPTTNTSSRRTAVGHGPRCLPQAEQRDVLTMCLFFFSIILYSSCIAYDRPGLSPRHFLIFYLCSRVGPLPYNPARHPAFIKAPRLLGSVPSYLLVLAVATADPHLLSLPRSSILHVSQAGRLQC
jgi:hypothetical protein